REANRRQKDNSRSKSRIDNNSNRHRYHNKKIWMLGQLSHRLDTNRTKAVITVKPKDVEFSWLLLTSTVLHKNPRSFSGYCGILGKDNIDYR
ncbi:hypothetical protein CHS0354_017933, partial [Potamilus streckersoni]